MKRYLRMTVAACLAASLLAAAGVARSQVAPGASEVAAYTGLHAAAHRGDAAEIRRLAGLGHRVDARDSRGRTPLHVATFARRPQAIRALAQAGADLGALEGDRYDAVTIAAVANDEETLRALIEAGANLRLADRQGRTPLMLARERGYVEMVRMLEAGGRSRPPRSKPVRDGA